MNRAADVRLILEKTGWNQTELAVRLGTTQPTVSRWLKGSEPDTSIQFKLNHLLDDLGVRTLTQSRDRRNIFKVVGVVGLGETVTMADGGPGDPFDEIELPYSFSVDNCEALIARGNSQFPRIKNGDVVIFHRNNASAEELVNREVIVRLVDGRTLLKTIKPSRESGRFDLHSHNDEAIEGVEVDWVGEILSIVPAGAWSKVR